jgi:RecA/RadA recombinase
MSTREFVLLFAGMFIGSGLTLFVWVIAQLKPSFRRQIRRSTYVPPSIEGRKYQRQYKKMNKNFDNSLRKMQKALDKY